MIVIIVGLGASFLASLMVSTMEWRSLFSRQSGAGSILATLLATLGLVALYNSPTVQNAQLPPQAISDDVETPPIRLAALFPTPSDNLAPSPAPAERLEPKPIKIIDAYSAEIPDAPKAYRADIQSYLLNDQFGAARRAYLDLIQDQGLPSEQLIDRWEAQALRQIRPIPASDRVAHLEGYRFLSALRPDEDTYLAKIERYSD